MDFMSYGKLLGKATRVLLHAAATRRKMRRENAVHHRQAFRRRHSRICAAVLSMCRVMHVR